MAESGKLVIRKANVRDIDVLATMDRTCFTAHWSREAFRRDLEENKIAFYLIGEVDGVPVGYAGLWHIIDEGHITNVAVMPKYRQRNIASAILKALFDVTAENGIKHYTLEVRVGNLPAIRLYEKFGFIGEGVRPKYYEDNGEDALIMWRREEMLG